MGLMTHVHRCFCAVQELHAVASSIVPLLEPLLDACRAYHTHTPSEGWITTGGFMTAARRAGLALSRAEFLSLERALTKDSFGRINFVQVGRSGGRTQDHGCAAAAAVLCDGDGVRERGAQSGLLHRSRPACGAP